MIDPFQVLITFILVAASVNSWCWVHKYYRPWTHWAWLSYRIFLGIAGIALAAALWV